jgi:preprotein translocase subunit SecA
MRLFGSDRIAGLMDKMGAEEGEVIEHPWVTRSIEGAQKRIELQNFQARKRLLEYDDVMNQQREVIYSLRLFALEGGEELKAEAIRMIEAAMEKPVTEAIGGSKHPEQWDLETLREQLQMRFLISVPELAQGQSPSDEDALRELVKRHAGEAFHRKVAALDSYGQGLRMLDQSGREVPVDNLAEQILSQVMLRVLDDKWKDHLYDLDQLRNAITYRAWGQKDPLIEYKQEAYSMFVDLMGDLRATFTDQFLKVQVSAGPSAPPPPPPRTFSGPALPGSPPPRSGASEFVTDADRTPAPAGQVAEGGARPSARPPVRLPSSGAGLPPGWERTGRNELCPCGSGKKFKKCHGKDL